VLHLLLAGALDLDWGPPARALRPHGLVLLAQLVAFVFV